MVRWIFCLAGAMTLPACDPPPRMRVNAAVLTTGADVVVTFDAPLEGGAANQYWVALQPADAPAPSTVGRIVLERRVRSVRLRTVAPGTFKRSGGSRRAITSTRAWGWTEVDFYVPRE
jgi:hypothetical protein